MGLSQCKWMQIRITNGGGKSKAPPAGAACGVAGRVPLGGTGYVAAGAAALIGERVGGLGEGV